MVVHLEPPIERVGVTDHEPKLRPEIVTETAPDVAVFETADETAGASKVNWRCQVPTNAVTVNSGLYPAFWYPFLPCSVPIAHCTVVPLVQELVAHAYTSLVVAVGVGATEPKFSPWIVIVDDPDTGKFLSGNYERTGASYVNL